MGRLSTFAKNRILNLRFQKSYRIKQIAITLQQEDSIKVSRKSISTFLKKYIETKSIHDKPRSGRNKKLTPEEINLIGEVTRLNRDITAPKIKEYLNLNVSTYTILRASKLFEWNKLNPNSNEAKKAAALERQSNGEIKRRRSSKRKPSKAAKVKSEDSASTTMTTTTTSGNTSLDLSDSPQVSLIVANNLQPAASAGNDEPMEQENELKSSSADPNLNLISEAEVLMTKNVSSSPMVFATKILYKIFELNELLGHNVSGKTFNKFIKNKKALDEKRIMYIKWLVENHFDASNKEELWKACRTAINKSIRNNEIKGLNASSSSQREELVESYVAKPANPNGNNLTIVTLNKNEIPLESLNTSTLLSLQPNMTVFQITNDLTNLDVVLNKIQDNSNYQTCKTNTTSAPMPQPPLQTSIVTLTDPPEFAGELIHDENKTYMDLSNFLKQG